MFDLSGKKALVTGSTQGIGKAIAACLAEHGAEVIVHGSTSEDKCRAAAKEMPGTPKIAVTDLAAPDCADTLCAQCGDVDILVLNASVQIRKSWDAITAEELEWQMNVNFRSSLLLVQKFAPAMLKKGFGRIVLVGSVQQFKPHKDMAVYAASKEAQISLVKNLAKQFAPYGVTVNGIAPGVFATPRNENALRDEAYAKQVYAGIPVGYAAEPRDCAPAALLLCSEEGRYITGTDLVVDGGMHL